MQKLFVVLIFTSMVLAACGPAPTTAPTAPATEIPTSTSSPTSTPPPTEAPTPEPAPPDYPLEGYGPANFPSDVNPLTGLKSANPALLDRRPMVIKVANLSRDVRPQWGLSLADIVFEYYTEEGGSRFAAIFYGNDADLVGPIRSGRFIDTDIVRGYEAVFAFGSAYEVEWQEYIESEFANRLVVEGSSSPMVRYEPNGLNYLVVKTADLSLYATQAGMQNVRQDLNGMFFQLEVPPAGQPGKQVFIRYSGSIYNRWDYEAATGKYLRFSETAEDYDNNNAQYAQLTDRLSGQPIAFDNVVFLYASHDIYSTDSSGTSIYDINLGGSGDAYAFRDGQGYQLKWQRNDTDVISLTNPDGTPFASKPGATWFEVIGVNSTAEQTDQSWRFTHQMP
jgi:hypothetical protein